MFCTQEGEGGKEASADYKRREGGATLHGRLPDASVLYRYVGMTTTASYLKSSLPYEAAVFSSDNYEHNEYCIKEAKKGLATLSVCLSAGFLARRTRPSCSCGAVAAAARLQRLVVGASTGLQSLTDRRPETTSNERGRI